MDQKEIKVSQKPVAVAPQPRPKSVLSTTGVQPQQPPKQKPPPLPQQQQPKPTPPNATRFQFQEITCMMRVFKKLDHFYMFIKRSSFLKLSSLKMFCRIGPRMPPGPVPESRYKQVLTSSTRFQFHKLIYTDKI